MGGSVIVQESGCGKKKKKDKIQVDRKPASNAYFLPTQHLVVCVQSCLVVPLADPSSGLPFIGFLPYTASQSTYQFLPSVRAELPL